MERRKKARELQDDMMESAHRIWLAGLGAMVVAQEEGSKAFKTLVDRGEGVEKKGRQQVEKAKDTVGGFRTVAESYWETMGRTVDDQITAVIHRLGVPTKDEIAKLTAKVEELTKSVEKLRTQQATAGAKTTSKSSTTRKSAGTTKN